MVVILTMLVMSRRLPEHARGKRNLGDSGVSYLYRLARIQFSNYSIV